MITKDLRRLLGRLNGHLTRALEAAAGFAISRSHYEVTLEHLLAKLAEDGTSDVPKILHHYEVDVARFWQLLQREIDSMRGGNSGKPSLSVPLFELLESAWVVSSVEHDLTLIRSGALIEAALSSPSTRALSYMEPLEKIGTDDLRRNFMHVVAGSGEDQRPGTPPVTGVAGEPTARGADSALARFTLDFTGRARAGQIDPVFGRDAEIRSVVDVLLKRRKNNPILVGEAGVGKTAIVEGLAIRIVAGDVPESLRDVELLGLDLGLLQAGAGVKGEFENRLKGVISEVRESAKPIILFIDEAHTLIGAGGSAGTGDAANLLKPALARGELRSVAATTWSEYKKYIEKDPALERRFQLIKVEEPDEQSACVMLRGLKEKYESHHGVYISEQAVASAVRYSHRFIAGRQLPDKAVDLLDTASSRVKLGLSTRPAALDDAERRLASLEISRAAIAKDMASGVPVDPEVEQQIREQIESLAVERKRLEEKWEAEKGVVERIRDLRGRHAEVAGTNGKGLMAEIEAARMELVRVQEGEPLTYAEVGPDVTARVVSEWTGIPAGRMAQDEAEALVMLEKRLGSRVLGQDHALREIGDTIRISKAGMRDARMPIGVFLLAGPSGTGKTETALGIADLLFGGDRFLVTINMSEYQESHTVSQLKGSPPGYVGYGEGGVLTEAVRHHPYSVVLLDEVEKAHRDVMNLFYQVFDKGFMRDGEGREIDFKNTVIAMTSNLGTDTIMEMCTGEGAMPSAVEIREAVRQDLMRHFQPALLARMKVIPFYPIDPDTMQRIVGLKLAKVGNRLSTSHRMRLVYDDRLIRTIASRCTEIETGARNIDFIIERTLLPELSVALLGRLAEDKAPPGLSLGFDEQGNFRYRFLETDQELVEAQAAARRSDGPGKVPGDEPAVDVAAAAAPAGGA
jgi:type VI secretion system protein VasG